LKRSSVSDISYHLIEFSREALRGDQNASFYSMKARARLSPRHTA
jgi:hypothetical protein